MTNDCIPIRKSRKLKEIPISKDSVNVPIFVDELIPIFFLPFLLKKIKGIIAEMNMTAPIGP